MIYDCAVVGAGLAGLECARRLGERGWHVLLLDAKGDLGREVHTTGIFVRRTLDDYPLDEALLGPPIRDVTLHSPGGRSLHLASAQDEYRIGRMPLLYRTGLARAVAAGVVWSGGTRLTGVERTESGHRLSLRTGRRPWSARARVVVGADGARSRVARSLGLVRNTRLLVGAEQVLAGVPLQGPPALHCYLEPRLAPGYIGWFAHDGTEAHVGVAGYPERFRPVAALGALVDRVAQQLDLSGAEPTEFRAGVIPVGGVLARIATGDAVLVGDAAGAVSPLTAGGLDPAIRLSAFAADLIDERLRCGDPAVLERFDGRAFRGRFRSRLLLRALLARMSSPSLAELAVAALCLPGLRDLAAQVFFGRGSFPDPQDVGLVATPAPDGTAGQRRLTRTA